MEVLRVRNQVQCSLKWLTDSDSNLQIYTPTVSRHVSVIGEIIGKSSRCCSLLRIRNITNTPFNVAAMQHCRKAKLRAGVWFFSFIVWYWPVHGLCCTLGPRKSLSFESFLLAACTDEWHKNNLLEVCSAPKNMYSLFRLNVFRTDCVFIVFVASSPGGQNNVLTR